MQSLLRRLKAVAPTFLLLLLLPASLHGQPRGDVSIAIGHTPGDLSPNLSIYGNQTNYLQFWIQNDDEIRAIELGVEFTWSPGFVIDFDTNYGGSGRAVKRRGDAVGAFDSWFFEWHYFDGVSPESLAVSGYCLAHYLPAHATPALCFEMKFDVTGTVPSSGVPAIVRVDNVIVPPNNVIWAMADLYGGFPPTFQGLPNSSYVNPDAPLVTADISAWQSGQPCGDVDCNQIVNVSDVVYSITYIFAGGPEPCAGCP